jgi:hypothetical protein
MHTSAIMHVACSNMSLEECLEADASVIIEHLCAPTTIAACNINQILLGIM